MLVSTQERQGRRDAIQASVKGVFKDCDRAIQDMMRCLLNPKPRTSSSVKGVSIHCDIGFKTTSPKYLPWRLLFTGGRRPGPVI